MGWLRGPAPRSVRLCVLLLSLCIGFGWVVGPWYWATLSAFAIAVFASIFWLTSGVVKIVGSECRLYPGGYADEGRKFEIKTLDAARVTDESKLELLFADGGTIHVGPWVSFGGKVLDEPCRRVAERLQIALNGHVR